MTRIGTRRSNLVLLALIFTFDFFSAFPLVAANNAKPANRKPAETKPTITMEAALETKLAKVEDVAWLSSTELIGSWEEPEAKEASLEVWDVATGKRHTFAQGKSPAVSPDQHWLAYIDDQQWKLRSLRDGTTRPLGEPSPFAPTVFSPPQWSRDSRYISIVDTLRPPPAPAVKVVPDVVDGVHVIDIGKAADGSGARLYKDVPRIRIFDVQTPDRPRVVSIDEDFVYYGSWGPGRTYYFVAMQGYWGGKKAHTVLKRLDTETMKISEVYRIEDGFMQEAAPRISPDGRYVAVSLDVDLGKWDDYNSLVLVDTSTGSMRRLTTKQYVGREYAWAPDGKSIYFIGRFGGLNQLYRADLNGGVKRVTQEERFYRNPQVSGDGQWMVYVTEDGYSHKDIRVRSLRDNQEKVVTVTADPGREYRFGEFKQVKWKSYDGLEIFGYLFLPPDFDANKKYPMYVDVHGGGPGEPLLFMGPLGAALTETGLEWHAWAALGYVVFTPDMRSSGEYGPRVAEKRYTTHTWDWGSMEDDVKDVESGTRWMISQGYVDPKRVAVFGHSAGGGRVGLLLTQSNLYSAGIIHDPIPFGALPSMITVMSGEYTGMTFDESHLTNGVKLADDPSVYTGGFLFDGYKDHTPTLILVGNHDKGAIDPLSPEVLFTILRQYHVPTRMLRYMDDGHNPLTAASALHRYGEIRTWLETYIPPPAH